MKKGQKLKCVRTKGNYLTVGLVYEVISGLGDNVSPLGAGNFDIEHETGFAVRDDEGDIIYQAKLIGGHAYFEIVG